jgi:hypothetical protein
VTPAKDCLPYLPKAIDSTALSETRLGARRVIGAIVCDASEHKRVDQMKNEFVSTVSHELRTTRLDRWIARRARRRRRPISRSGSPLRIATASA